ncbi:MAG: hypothetical protein QOG56_1138 [Solirubrobacteraceae bacterium]|nr:hypothetical protein [Solirubrobacteraceae bacterium]
MSDPRAPALVGRGDAPDAPASPPVAGPGGTAAQADPPPLGPRPDAVAAPDRAAAPGVGPEPSRSASSLHPGVDAAREAHRGAQLADALRIAGYLSIAAGLIHAIAMIDHFSHYWLFGVFFLVLTYGQVLWGLALLRGRSSDRGLRLGAFANLAIVAVWLVSRTLGVPFGPNAGDPEPIGPMDVAATLDQLVLVAYVGVLLLPRLRDGRLRALLGRHRIRFGMMLCSASVFTALLGGHQH